MDVSRVHSSKATLSNEISHRYLRDRRRVSETDYRTLFHISCFPLPPMFHCCCCCLFCTTLLLLLASYDVVVVVACFVRCCCCWFPTTLLLLLLWLVSYKDNNKIGASIWIEFPCWSAIINEKLTCSVIMPVMCLKFPKSKIMKTERFAKWKIINPVCKCHVGL